MKIIKLPVKFMTEEASKEVERLESLDIPFNEDHYATDGSLYVNVAHIVCFNKDTEGMVNLTLSDSFNHKIFMKFEEFEELLNNLND